MKNLKNPQHKWDGLLTEKLSYENFKKYEAAYYIVLYYLSFEFLPYSRNASGTAVKC